MYRAVLISFIILGVLSANGAGNSIEQPPADQRTIERQLIQYEKGVSNKEKDAIIDMMGAILQYRFRTINADIVSVPLEIDKNSLPAGVKAVMGDVVLTEDYQPDSQVDPSYFTSETQVSSPEKKGKYPVNDPLYVYQSALHKLYADVAWQVSKGSKAIKVGIISTGIDCEHVDLAGNMWTNEKELSGIAGVDDDGNGYVDDIHGANFLWWDPYYGDKVCRGTCKAGTLGAVTDNNIGVAGLSHNVSIVMLKHSSWDWIFPTMVAWWPPATLQCIDYASETGVDILIIDVSIFRGEMTDYGDDFFTLLREAIENFPGIVVVAPSSHLKMRKRKDIDKKMVYPACYDLPNIITVSDAGSYQEFKGRHYNFYGKKNIDIMSTSGPEDTTRPEDKYEWATTVEDAQVGATIVLLKSAYPEMTNEELINRIIDSADFHISMIDRSVSQGLLNIGKALIGRSVGGRFIDQWTHVAFDAPPHRNETNVVYVPQRDVVVLYGGSYLPDGKGPDRYHEDTWEFDGKKWEKKADGTPSGRYYPSMALDRNGKVVLFGGYIPSDTSAETWLWDGEEWQLADAEGPRGLFHHGMVYDENRGVTVLYGGVPSRSDKLRETWEWDGAKWELKSTQSPSANRDFAITYNDSLKKVVLHGGLGAGEGTANEFFTWDGKNWKRFETRDAPPDKRYDHGFVYDANRNVSVLYGGVRIGLCSGEDTWELHGKEWRMISWRGRERTSGLRLVYDSKRQRVLRMAGSSYTIWDQYTRKGDMMQTWQYHGGVETAWIDNLVCNSADFNGDGKADIAVWRPSDGSWHVQGENAEVFGQRGDIPVPADYDGDGAADMAVYRQSTCEWIIEKETIEFGNIYDIPAPADYNGDGKAEIAVYRPYEGNYYIYKSEPVLFETPEALPVPGDYDGDGIDEPALYIPHTSTFVFADGSTVTLGEAGCSPVPADYNGDGRVEIAVWNPNSRKWQRIDPVTGKQETMTRWGKKWDIPVPGDYDGDGKADIATFTPATGTWRIKGGKTVVHGSIGDVPLVRGN